MRDKRGDMGSSKVKNNSERRYTIAARLAFSMTPHKCSKHSLVKTFDCTSVFCTLHDVETPRQDINIRAQFARHSFFIICLVDNAPPHIQRIQYRTKSKVRATWNGLRFISNCN